MRTVYRLGHELDYLGIGVLTAESKTTPGPIQLAPGLWRPERDADLTRSSTGVKNAWTCASTLLYT
jgi:hypothetical protein